MKITNKQNEVLTAIKEISKSNGIMPTLNELKDYLKYGNTSSVQRHTDALRKKGFLITDKNQHRSFRIKNELQKKVNVPLVGNIACGEPILATERIEAYIPYDNSKIKDNSRNYFFLRAVGDSMDKAGIYDGDYCLIRMQNDANNSEKVVALIGDDATIKILKKESKSKYILEPRSTNPIHKPIYLFDDFCIQGVVVDVIHNK